MLVEVRFLSESAIAAPHLTLVLSLVSMDAEVVEEVMPLPEHLPAAFMLTQH